MKIKHKHNWENRDEVEARHSDILHCSICNKLSKVEKSPPRKNGCFGYSKFRGIK